MRDRDTSVPCYGCDRRCAGCHSSCESYKEYQDKVTAEREAIRKKKETEAMMTNTRIRSIEKTRKAKPKQTMWRG